MPKQNNWGKVLDEVRILYLVFTYLYTPHTRSFLMSLAGKVQHTLVLSSFMLVLMCFIG